MPTNQSTFANPVRAAALLILFCGSVGAIDVPIPASTSVVKSGKVAKFSSKAPHLLPLPGSADDPTLHGATLTIFDTSTTGAGAISIRLDATGWKGLGRPARSKGYRYKSGDDAVAGDAGCKVVILKDDVIKAVCKGAHVALSTPFAGNQAVILSSGDLRYCAELGGATRRNDDKVFKRVDAPAPQSCTVEATATPSHTATGTATASATNSGTATSTGTTTVTPTITNTPTMTRTATFTRTRTPTLPPGTPPAFIGGNTCEINSSVSRLFLQLGATGVLVRPSGSFDVDCGAPDASGLAPCACDVAEFDAIPLLGIGDVCISPAGPCDDGMTSCLGGTALDVRLLGDHNVASCSDQASCATACDSYCASGTDEPGYPALQRLDSTCEGFCADGPNADMPCDEDTDCPESNCPGKEPAQQGPHDGVCNCTCTGQGLGSPAPPGSLACNLGMRITVERDNNQICGDTTPSITLAPMCGPITTGTGDGLTLNANNSTAASGRLPPGRNSNPLTKTGVARSCQQLAGNQIAGLHLVGYLQFFDSTLGDILVEQELICQ